MFASIIACPIAYIIGHSWLANFAFQAKVGIVPYLVSILISCLGILIISGYQVIKVRSMNLINNFRGE